MSAELNHWHRRAIHDSSDIARDAFTILEDKVDSLRRENDRLRSEVEHLEDHIKNPPAPPSPLPGCA